ncbi:MAG: SH3 domain-containing protein [Caldilineales bacterium]|nr:SH3 domain-containing protein [Caldilineales bacterium]
MRSYPSRLVLLVLLLAFVSLGCALTASLAGREPDASPVAERPTLHPTFTPTPVREATPTPIPLPTDTPIPPPPTDTPIPPPTDTPAAPPPTDTPAAPPPTATPAAPQIRVSASVVNLRSGPGTNYSQVGQARGGQQFPILARNQTASWVQLETSNGAKAWVINDSRWTQVVGDVNSVAVAADIPTPPPTARPRPTNTPAPTPTPVPSFAFNLESQEQFPESNIVRIFLYVYSSSETALGGYSLRVKQNGNELPVTGLSAGGQPSHTWPIAGDRQRLTNLKVEFAVAPAGAWQVQLVDGSGVAVGPPATFTLIAGDQNQEMYVRYKRK